MIHAGRCHREFTSGFPLVVDAIKCLMFSGLRRVQFSSLLEGGSGDLLLMLLDWPASHMKFASRQDNAKLNLKQAQY